MSDRLARRIVAPTLAVALAASVTGVAADALGGVKGADLELLAEVRHIAAAVEQVRGQRFERPPVAVRVPDEMRRVAAEIRAYNVLSRDRLAARGRAWADIGLGDGATPGLLMTTLAADLADVAYDPASHRVMVAPGRLEAEELAPREGAPDDDTGASTVLQMTGVRVDEPLVCHLLMHVRQHERTGGELLDETTDRLLARAAWFEGEANLVAIRRLFGGMGLADEILSTRLDPGTVLDGQLLPPGIDRLAGVERGLVEFVYREGFARAVETFRAGGWPALDRAIATLDTTRDLLHPERAGRPTGVPEDGAAPAPGLRRLDVDSLGEQVIVVLVSQQTDKINLGLLAGDGWAGDRLERWEAEGAPDAGVTRWTSAWTDERTAEDFRYGIQRVLEARFGPPRGEEHAGRHWRGGDRRHELVREGTLVRLIVRPAG